MENTSENIPRNLSSPALEYITWNNILNPLFLIIHLLPNVENGILLATILRDPLKCFRSSSSYLVINLGLLGFLPLLTLILNIITLSGNKDQHLWLCGFVFGLCNTMLAVLMLTMDRYVLACKPLLYSTIITKRRVFYCVIFSWILSGILVAITVLQLYEFFKGKVLIKMFVFALFPIFCFLVIVITILNIKTWQTVARHESQVQSFGRQNSKTSRNLKYRAEKKRLENERRFAKVVLLLLINMVLFMEPPLLIVGMKSVNVWCDFCFTDINHPNVSLLQMYFFPLFYITTPVLYILFIPKYRKSCRRLFC